MHTALGCSIMAVQGPSSAASPSEIPSSRLLPACCSPATFVSLQLLHCSYCIARSVMFDCLLQSQCLLLHNISSVQSVHAHNAFRLFTDMLIPLSVHGFCCSMIGETTGWGLELPLVSRSALESLCWTHVTLHSQKKPGKCLLYTHRPTVVSSPHSSIQDQLL